MTGTRSGESVAARWSSPASSSRGAIAGALLRGIASRRLLSAGALILTALAVASAVLGPAFQTSVVRSYVVSRIDATPAVRTGLSWTFDPTAATAGGGAQAVVDVAEQRAAEASGDFAPPESSIETARFPVLGGAGMLMAREGACDHVVVGGRCPTNTREVLVAADDLETNGLQVGQLISSTSTDVPPLEVVGSYTVPETELAFWFDLDRLVSRPQMPSRAPNVPDLPYRPAPFLTDLSTFALVEPSLWQVRVDRRIDLPGSADAAALDLAAATAADLQTAPVQLPEGTWRAVGVNDLPGIAQDVRRQREVAAATVQPSVISLVLVALALLLRLTLAATEQRRAELALAGLRGLAARRLWLLGLAEPLAVVAVAAPIGVVAGWLGLTGLTRLWLVPGLDIALPPSSWVGAGLMMAAGVAVAVVAVGAVIRQTLAGQLAGTRRPVASGRVVMAARLVVLAVAVAAVVTQLAVPPGARPDALALALPVLVALAAGLVATAAVTSAAKWWVDRSGSGRRIPVWVASRAVSRRSEATVIVLPLSVAIAVAVFAAGVFGAAAAWRASVAATIAPGEVVWSSPLTMSESVDLTHRLDPDGRHLMALAIVPSVGVRVVAAVRRPHQRWRLRARGAWVGPMLRREVAQQRAEVQRRQEELWSVA